jgi:hypothetical protein
MQQAREQNENTVGANRIVLERITQEQNVLSNAQFGCGLEGHTASQLE